MNPVVEAGKYKNLTASATVYSGRARLLGVFCASSSSGTLKVADANNTVVNTFSLTAGAYYPIPAECETSIVATIGGTADVTFFFQPN